MRLRTLLLFTVVLFVTGLCGLWTSTAYAQDPSALAPTEDPIEQLRLAPEQRQRIRAIFEENKAERQTTNRRVREANLALDQALDTEPVNEALIDQRLNDLAAAQAAQMRMKIQTELKIRRELRPEQLSTLRRLRLQMRDFMDAQRPPNRQRPNAQGLAPRRNLPPR